MFACQSYETKDYCKIYIANDNGNIVKSIIFCKAKDLTKAI